MTVCPLRISEIFESQIIHAVFPSSAAFLGDGVPVYEICDEAGENNDMLVNTNAKGRALAKVLGPHPVALMRGHGDAVVGPSLQVAMFRAVYTEVNANLQMQATLLAGPITPA